MAGLLMNKLNEMKAFFTNYEDEDYVSSYIDDEDDVEDVYEEEFEEPKAETSHNVFQSLQARKPQAMREAQAVMQTKANQEEKVLEFNRLSSQQVVVVKPEAIEDGQVIANEIRAGRVVLCNFEDLDSRRAQRIIDFLTGSAFALGGKVMPVSSLIFIITPLHVELRDGLEEKEEMKTVESLRKIVNAY